MATTKPLAATSFMSEPDDDLATADVYTIDTSDPINNLPVISQDQLTAENAVLEEGLRGGGGMAAKLPFNTDAATAGAAGLVSKAGSATSLLSKAKDASSSTMGSLGSLTKLGSVGGLTNVAGGSTGSSIGSLLKSGTVTGIPGLSGVGSAFLGNVISGGLVPKSLSNAMNAPVASTLGSKLTSGGVTSAIPSSKLTSAFQMSGVLNGVMGNSGYSNSITNNDNSVRLISGLASSGMSSGIPNSFSQVKGLAGGNNTILTSAAAIVLKSASSSGNISGMKDVVTNFGGNNATLLASSPNVLTNAAQNYTKPLPIGTSWINGPSTTPEFTDTVETFNTINPSWASTTRTVSVGGTTAQESSINLSVIQNGSSDFKSLMTQGANRADATTNPDLKYFAMASAFPVESPESQLAKKFPMTVTTVSSSTQSSIDSLSSSTSDYLSSGGRTA